jgi:flagellar basal body-associated protein FliL
MNLFLKSLVIMLVISMIGVGSLLGWQYWTSEKAAKPEAVDVQSLPADKLLKYIVETESITTDLYSGGYIQTQFSLQTDSPETKLELDKRRYEVESIIIKILSQMKKEELMGTEGLLLAEAKLKQGINHSLQKEAIVRVYTTDRLLQ